ncbi:hypothetical protein QTP88_027071 [Uroleucon formosanum]
MSQERLSGLAILAIEKEESEHLSYDKVIEDFAAKKSRKIKFNALLTIDDCLIYWKKARIPNQDRDNCAKKLKKLYEDLRSLEKNKTKIGNLHRLREKQFEETLDDLFDIAHSNAMNIIKIDEDKEFLLLQRQKGRVGCMLGRDIKLAEKEQRKATRKDAEYKRKNIQQNSGYLKTGNQYLYKIQIFIPFMLEFPKAP